MLDRQSLGASWHRLLFAEPNFFRFAFACLLVIEVGGVRGYPYPVFDPKNLKKEKSVGVPR